MLYTKLYFEKSLTFLASNGYKTLHQVQDTFEALYKEEAKNMVRILKNKFYPSRTPKLTRFNCFSL